LATLAPIIAAVVSYTLIAWMLKSKRLALPLDRPNERSLHSTPVPRTGGLGIMAGAAAGLALARYEPLVLVLAVALAAISIVDDRRGLPIALRFGSHAVAAATFVLVCLPSVGWLAAATLTLATMWLVNLYNFMDGADGLAGGMAAFGFGTYAAAAWFGGSPGFALSAASVAAAAVAFLAFNFHPARIFMGDVGSIPLGFLAASVGLLGWRDGLWPLWFPVLVFSPFIVDASVTLARRVLRGERFWQAHKTHYYQRLVQIGWGHRKTALAEYALMAGCALLALAARTAPPSLQAAALALAAIAYVSIAFSIDRVWHAHARLGQ
jgi:UDP-N-acetylmuramyl pentapeptide phosphotransferase/UDP-N-acetylglucosamine-1-phosphate transferase